MNDRGIITIATGSEKYYAMARNLMHSIKVNDAAMKVAIITDKNNHMVQGFDDVIIVENPYNSYMDKIEMIRLCPYKENLFLDADSLIIGNMKQIWTDFDNASDFSCYGKMLPLDSSERAWFNKDSVGEYNNRIHYLANLHGGVYFCRRGQFCDDLYEMCKKIEANYHQYKFTTFAEPADEPIIALACSVLNAKLVDKLETVAYLPGCMIKECNVFKKKLRYKYYEDTILRDAVLIHFGNYNTKKSRYIYLAELFEIMYSCQRIPLLDYKLGFRYMRLWSLEHLSSFSALKDTLYIYSPDYVQRIYRKIRNREKELS